MNTRSVRMFALLVSFVLLGLMVPFGAMAQSQPTGESGAEPRPPIPPYFWRTYGNPDGSIGPFACSDCPQDTYCYFPPHHQGEASYGMWCTRSKEKPPADEISSTPPPPPRQLPQPQFGCINALGQWVANGFCHPAEANPFPPPCDPQAAAPPAGGGVLPPQTAINMMELWSQRIEGYWFQQFFSHNLRYHSPSLVQAAGHLEYVRNIHKIYYDPAIVSALVGQTGPFGLVIALAHEEGHSVQWLRGSTLEGMPRELDADRLAGSYLRWAEDNHFLHQCDIGAAAMIIFRKGDDLPPFNRLHHGSPQQRVDALLEGYLNGPDPSIWGSGTILPKPFPKPLH